MPSWARCFLLLLIGQACRHGYASDQPACASGLVCDQCKLRDFTAALERFSRVLQFETAANASAPNSVSDASIFDALHEYVAASYPKVWAQLGVERLSTDNLSLLVTWDGSEPGLKPILFISHIDVVPVTEDTLPHWAHPPFSGAIADGYVWGRGAIDVKIGFVGLLEAAEELIKEGFQPKRTLLFAFSHDEESLSGQGAGDTAKLLEQRYGKLEVIFDEGGLILSDGYPPMTTRPVALVMTSEKSYVSAKVSFTAKGGHSSMPPTDATSVGAIMGRVLTRLERHQLPPWLPQSMVEQLQLLAPKAPQYLRPVLKYAHQPLVGRFLAEILARKTPESRAMVQTTAVATMLQAGVSHNVLPQTGEVIINYRVLPGERLEDVKHHLEDVVLGPDAAHAKVDWTWPTGSVAKVPLHKAPHFQLLAAALKEVYSSSGQELDVVPSLLSGGTDSKFYAHLTEHGVLRHIPITANRTAGDIQRIHGTDERVAVEDVRRAFCVYQRVVAGAGMLGDDAATV